MKRLAPPHRASSRAAFTILELLVLLTALTVIASVGIPAYFTRPSVTLDSAAKLLAKDLREVQNRAALYEEALMIRFDEDGHGYSATDRRGQPLLSPYGRGAFVRDYDVDAVFRGVRVESVRAAKGGRVPFDPSGRPETSAEVVLTFRGEQRTVTLRAGSGLISIDGLDEPWVDLGL